MMPLFSEVSSVAGGHVTAARSAPGVRLVKEMDGRVHQCVEGALVVFQQLCLATDRCSGGQEPHLV